MANRRSLNARNLPIEVKRTNYKSRFAEGDTAKMSLVIFDDGLKRSSHLKYRGRRVGVSDVIYKNLKRRQNLKEALSLDINEFRTSSVCPNCKEMKLRTHRVDDKSFFNILICNVCNILWNRDILAAKKNMMFIACQIWANMERPVVFTRQNRQRTT
ncbi:uncharacterized protein BX663DRAFT_489226 [Cokeromyces recurvatus]|uniref:uncharacterized protein n=1 Tax=Cokeromyces recurvatus TaxID=90255 RepID=UPI0022204F32|nr:uncharacterized protein BX663DRAFT_489226 [Cokeromyces recurvatus]KAI7899331.1 hypothetical protein BX663DRAFT_489226 [Cokeromyces recurvatus]